EARAERRVRQHVAVVAQPDEPRRRHRVARLEQAEVDAPRDRDDDEREEPEHERADEDPEPQVVVLRPGEAPPPRTPRLRRTHPWGPRDGRGYSGVAGV